jgi:5-methylcytosine-specific restriction endonuclease McrBC regulatory subunit McrC
VLQDRFGEGVVTKKGSRLPGSKLTLNPDIRFWNDRAVADVKYKVGDGEWQREDLYQALAFAAALRCF